MSYTNLGKNDAQSAASGINEGTLTLEKEIAAQHAIISSAQEHINQLARQPLPKTEQGLRFGGWVYSMADLEKWVKLFNGSNSNNNNNNTNKQEEEEEMKKAIIKKDGHNI